VQNFFTIEEAAKLAEVNLLDLIEWIESGKMKPSNLIELVQAGAPIDVLMPPGSIIEPREPVQLFTRSKIREIQSLKAPRLPKPRDDKSSPKPKTLKAWNPKADPNMVYTPEDLAEAWQWSVATVRRLFENEDGVMKRGEENPRKKRRYVTLRIPQAVALRVYRKLSS